MLYYERIRIALRGMKNLKISLTEIPLNNEAINFPPMIERARY